MNGRTVQRNSVVGWLARIFQRIFVGRRTNPVRLLGMALFLALPFYILFFVYTPNNGLDSGRRNSRELEKGLDWRPGISGAVRGQGLGNTGNDMDTDRLGRVLMKGGDADVKQNNQSPDKPAAAVVQSSSTKATEKPSRTIDGIAVIYMGCYKDVAMRKRRALQGAYFADSKKMTQGRCLEHCSSKSYPFAGLEFSSECYCGQAITASKAPSETYCNMTCVANSTQICGGAPYVSVFQIKRQDPGASQQQQQGQRQGGGEQQESSDKGRRYDFRVCVPRSNAEGESVFSGGIVMEQPSMTVDGCVRVCGENDHPLAGMTQGIKCHCGHLTVTFDMQDAVDSDLCNTPCPGDESLYCGSDRYVSIYQTPYQDERCANAVMMKPGTMPLIAVASFPGSGNTWVRYLIERATGIYTGSFYDDGDLYNKGFRGEREQWHKKNTVAVKTHRFDQEHISEFDGAILIIRDPYKAILSEHNRKFGGHTGFASERHYTKGTEWIDFVMGKSRTWTNTAVNFLQYNKKVLVVHYEDLQTDLKPNLEKMVRFLKQPVDQERILCAISSPNGKYRRPSANHKLSFDPFTDEMKDYLTLYIKAVSMALHITNQTMLPDSYDPHLGFLLPIA